MVNNKITQYFPFLENKKNYIEEIEGKIPTSKIRENIEINPKKQKLYDVALEFESLFVKMMLNSMRNTLNKESDLFYAGIQQDIFQDMLYDEYSKIFAKNANLGLAKEIYHQLENYVPEESATIIKLQEQIQNQKKYKNQIEGLITTEKNYQQWYK
ncbi:MAG: rod-binding protein [Leptonema sp. (in: bacteria)]